MKVFTVFGTRPEAIKMCPLVLKLKENKNIIFYYPRINEEGKKIGIRDDFRAIYRIWEYRHG